MKKITVWTLVFIFCCGIFAAGFSFDLKYGNIVTGDTKVARAAAITASTSLAGGGTPMEPYEISTAGDLAFLSVRMAGSHTEYSTYYNKYFKFVYTEQNNGEIDFSGLDFVSIGASALTVDYTSDNGTFSNAAAVFSGHFNGEYTLSGERKFLKIKNLSSPLFNATELAFIRNIDFENVNITGTGAATGAVVNFGIDTEVRNCSVSGSVSFSGYAGGGIMGFGIRSSVFACENSAAVKSNNSVIGSKPLSSMPKSGGLAGAMIKGGLGDCINTGKVSGTLAGGILGYGLQASINRSINAGQLVRSGTDDPYINDNNFTPNNIPVGEFIGATNTGCMIKSSFYDSDINAAATGYTPGTLIGARNYDGENPTGSPLLFDTVEVTPLSTVQMAGPIQQKKNMGGVSAGSYSLEFKKWWDYSTTGYPRPIRWEMWVDSAEAPEYDSDSNTYILPNIQINQSSKENAIILAKNLAYISYMVNNGETPSAAIDFYHYLTSSHYNGQTADLGGKLWIPIGNRKNPYKGKSVGLIFYNRTQTDQYQCFIMNMTINTALSDQGFIGVVEPSASEMVFQNIHIGSVDIYCGSIGQTAGFATRFLANTHLGFINCILTGTILSYGDAAGFTGGFTEKHSDENFYPHIHQSGNNAAIKSDSGSASGIASKFPAFLPDANYDLNIYSGVANCFNTGAITALKGLAAGLIGFMPAPDEQTCILSTSYNAGAISGNNTAALIGGIGNGATATIDKCYYLTGQTPVFSAPVGTLVTNSQSLVLAEMRIDAQTPITGMTHLNYADLSVGDAFAPWKAKGAEAGELAFSILGNLGCPLPTRAFPFYNVETRTNEIYGDTELHSKIIIAGESLHNNPERQTSAAMTVEMTAIPMLDNLNMHPETHSCWVNVKSGPVDHGNINSITMVSGSADNMTGDRYLYQANFNPLRSVTVYTNDITKGTISAGLAAAGKSVYTMPNGAISGAAVKSTDTITLNTSENVGYSFLGFYTDKAMEETSRFTGFTNVENNYTITYNSSTPDLILYAKFGVSTVQSQVSIAYATGSNSTFGTILINGGAGPVTANAGTTVTLTAAVNGNNDFAGWYTDPAGNTPAAGSYQGTPYTYIVPASNATVYAKFIKKSQIRALVKTDCAGGGAVAVTGGNGYKSQNTTVEFTVTDITEHWVFKGWYIDSGCTVAAAGASTVFPYTYTHTVGAADFDLYAKFEKQNQLKVDKDSYNGDDKGDGTVAVTNGGWALPGEKVTISATPAASGTSAYENVFDGWYTDSTFTTKVSGITKTGEYAYEYTMGVAAETTVYAKFIRLNYFDITIFGGTDGKNNTGGTVEFIGGNGTRVLKGLQRTIKATPETGYIFSGWYDTYGTDDVAGSPIAGAQEEYTVTVTEEKQYYAKFTKVYFINAGNGNNPNGTGNVSVSNKHTGLLPGESVTLTATPTGISVFLGWYDNENFTGGEKSNPSGEPLAVWELTVSPENGDKTYYAKFLNQYSISASSSPADIGALSGGGLVLYGGGTTLTVTAVPGGYRFDGWYRASDTSFTNKLSIGDSLQLVITNITADADYIARFVIQYTVTLNAPVNGTVEFLIPIGAQSPHTFDANDRFALRAVPNIGYRFDGWYLDGGFAQKAFDGNSVDEITRDYSLFAKFTRVYFITAELGDSGHGTVSGTVTGVVLGSSVTLTATAESGYGFSGWYTDRACSENKRVSEDTEWTFSITDENGDKTYYAKFLYKYLINKTSDPESIGAGLSGGGFVLYGEGTTLTVTAVPDGYRFEGWFLSTDTSFTNKLSIGDSLQLVITNVTADADYIARFIKQYTVTLNAPVNGTVEFLIPIGAQSPHTFDANGAFTLKATPDTGYRFDGWYLDGGLTQKAFDGNSVDEITRDYSLFAKFTRVYFITAELGDSGHGTVSGTVTGVVLGGSVTLTATAESGYGFSGWYTDRACSENKRVSEDTEWTFNITDENGDKTYYAKFVIQYTVTAGMCAGSPGSASGGGTFNVGTEITVTATAPTEGTYRFAGWFNKAVDGDKIEDAGSTYTFTLTNNCFFYAKFVRTYNITIVITPAGGGTVNVSSGTYDEGTQLTLTAAAAANYRFVRWDGVGSQSGNDFTITVNGDLTYTAVFMLQHNVTIKAEPSAGGTIIDNSGKVDDGGSVELEVTAVAFGYRFNGWYRGSVNSNNKISGNYTYTVPDITAGSVFIASFIKTHTVTLSAGEGGSIPGQSVNTYDENTDVTITAIVSGYYKFTGWYDAETGGTRIFASNPYKITGIAQDYILFARFERVYSVTISITDGDFGNLSVKVNNLPVATADGLTQLSLNDNVALSVGTLPEGYEFGGWYSDSGFINRLDTVTAGTVPAFSVSSNSEYWVRFLRIYIVSVQIETPGQTGVTGGSVSITDTAGHSVTTWKEGDIVKFTAVPVENYAFAGWYSDAALTNRLSKENPYAVTLGESQSLVGIFNVNAEYKIYAKFSLVYIAEPTITVTLNPAVRGGTVTGGGEVTVGATVSLNAVADKGYKFKGWYDAATGKLLSKSAEYSFTAGDAALTLTPKFSKKANVGLGIGLYLLAVYLTGAGFLVYLYIAVPVMKERRRELND